MSTTAAADPILERLRRGLSDAYGPRLERVVLFGSRARGDHRSDSDYDVAVFLKQFTSLWRESGRLAELTTEILIETGADIAAMPFRAGAFREDRPLMIEIARDGVDL